MFVVPSTLQVLLATVFVLLGVCGNLVIPFVSYRTTLRGPHITVLAALDFTATLLGPGVMLVTTVKGPTWLEHNKSLCHSLSFLSSWILITCFLVLFVLAVFCQNLWGQNIDPGRAHYARRMEFETKINDPELTTAASSNTSFRNSRSRTKSIHSRIQSRIQSRNQSRIHSGNQSRRSSVRSRSGTILSFDSSMISRKNSQMACALENSLLETISRNACENDTGQVMSEALSERSPTPVNSERKDSPSPINSERKDSQSSSPSIQLSIAASQASFPRDPFVISPKIPYNVHAFLYIRRVFQSPQFLPQFTALQRQRSLLRLLSLILYFYFVAHL